jgi:hypothetical protein
MRYLFSLLALSTAAFFFLGSSVLKPARPRVLVFSKTVTFYHESIPAGMAALRKLGAENGFDVDTLLSRYFNEDSLKHYSAWYVSCKC